MLGWGGWAGRRGWADVPIISQILWQSKSLPLVHLRPIGAVSNTYFFLFLCFWAFLPSGGWGAPRGLVICFREVTVRDPPSRAPSNESECPSLPKAAPCEPVCKKEHPSPEQVSGY